MKRWLIVAAALATVLAVGPHRATADQEQTYVGSAICIRCHYRFAQQWAALDHSKTLLEDGRAPEKTGCEACHGPGAAHVAGQRNQIVKWEPLELDARSKICLQCHEDKIPADLWNDSAHGIVLSCDSCHEVHHESDNDYLLRRGATPTCLECHDDLPAKAEAKHHHPLLEDILTCANCHNFHGSNEEHMLVAPQGEMCAECHGDEVPKTDAHKREDYRLNHKAEAKADQEQCLMCHSEETFCNKCHVVKVPHAEDYALEHADEAKKRLATCLECHESDFCAVCHDPVPKPAAAAPAE